ncbi:DUF4262 domain-containing protein [Phenylobacterium sp.]|uniref:DUF4262 domain-containing protein n=1 Tax=Phenylobacterium sp. TaxID=1871053 RepID=UPI00301E420C
MFEKLRRDWHMRDIDARIRRHGWMAMYVGDYRTSPTWAYSIGFEERLGRPEVIVFDVTREDAHSLLWWIYTSVESGDLRMVDGEAWAPEGEVIGVWRDVHPTQVDAADGWFAAGLERRTRKGKDGGLRAFQLVVRDGAQKFPWDAGYDERLRHRQPALYIPAEDYGEVHLSPGDREALRIADERSWSIRLIDGPELKWAYTIGLSAAGRPELIAMLPSADGAANLLHEAQAHLARRDLVLEDGLRWDAPGFECCWRRVHESQHAALNVFFLAKLRHEHRTGRREAIETYQLFLPDNEGRYPWDAGCRVRESQPLLFEPFDPAQLKRGPLAALMRM